MASSSHMNPAAQLKPVAPAMGHGAMGPWDHGLPWGHGAMGLEDL